MAGKHTIKVLDIDLTTEKVEIIRREDLAPFIGGIGVAAKLFAELVQPDKDPLDPGQPIIFANGPLSTIFPVVTKTVAVFRSPLTGEWGESYAGMRLALAMRLSGYQAIIIRGKAARPVYLSISNYGVRFQSAAALWGLTVSETGSILRDLEPGRGHRSCIRIGPAGEQGVRFANVNVDTYRHFGRLGLGALFGSKNLKAMVVYGEREEKIENFSKYNQVYKEIYNKAVTTDIMDKYHGLGTAINVSGLNHLNGLPTRNLQQSSFEHGEAISGESFAAQSLVRKMACAGCPVGCIHIGLHRREFGPGYDFESKYLSYDHELIFALGSFLGMSTQDKIYRLIDEVEELGLDAISAGVLLGWITEACRRGVISEEQLGVKPEFDQTEPYLEILRKIIQQPNELYQTLALGTYAAAQRYGGQSYAMTLGKNEIAGYHTGYANILGQAVGARHSHLDNAGYAVDQKLKDKSPAEKVEALIKEEKWRNVLNCLTICLFAREIYQTDTVIKALAAIGISVTADDLEKLGQTIFEIKNKTRGLLGYQLNDLHTPERFFETTSLSGDLTRQQFNEMLKLYQKQIGLA
ncbi:aldehyde ferredoxin oxidoreductase N-terminal domain-containing protein [Desulforamulus hydrothermalis]|uniref:Aldehyde ferredoxin oxidoreductase n=1 Tax=Desulforamulus hydrothermalis Lam5 = DSM 18033 TaxID=1121428 RepID=K8E7L9_9FIRM|nr:aldehyde ferredoxin oxidoreductase N-terminal domain-containing protein [Desulforamulus hydrothermalis]CCO07513.1 Aldehyde ferredoxin oxidoreductase [Desulforamulus hydrothermalis Lam5 = DSM 18033]SHH16818.1 aldehyde:ferredoxin oxidoreductase [Desulforamulus hydrothermalis Lam5 = DSM 18033]